MNKSMTKKILPLLLCFPLVACSAGGNSKEGIKPNVDIPKESISENSKVQPEKTMSETTMDEAIKMFENKESGILYFGFEKCPWCKEAKPILEEVAEKEGVTIHYVKIRDKKLERLYSDEQKENIQQYISEYMSENDEGELTLYVPLVLVVKDGKVLSGHEGTVDGHDAHERKMTEKEAKTVKKTYRKMINSYMNALSSDSNSKTESTNNSAKSNACDESDVCTNGDAREED